MVGHVPAWSFVATDAGFSTDLYFATVARHSAVAVWPAPAIPVFSAFLSYDAEFATELHFVHCGYFSSSVVMLTSLR